MKDGEVKVSTKYRVQNRNTKEEVAQYVSLNHTGGQQYELPSINVIVRFEMVFHKLTSETQSMSSFLKYVKDRLKDVLFV